MIDRKIRIERPEIVDLADALREELVAAKALIEKTMPVLLRAILDLGFKEEHVDDDVLIDVYGKLEVAEITDIPAFISPEVDEALYTFRVEASK